MDHLFSITNFKWFILGPAAKSGVFLILEKLLSCHPYLPGLVHGFLWIALHLVAGMVRDLCDGLFEDRSCLSDRQRCVQIRLPLKFSNKRKEKQNKNIFTLLKCCSSHKDVQQGNRASVDSNTQLTSSCTS